MRLAQDFEPFGAVLATAGFGASAFGFTGEQADPTGLLYLRARFYDPATGRFLTKDPFPGFAALPPTLHPYQYVLNNPVNLTDPTGECVGPVALVCAGALAGGLGAVMRGAGYVLTHPGGNLGDYLSSGCFWKAVGVGFAAGAISGLVVDAAVGIGLFGTGLGAAVGYGALGGGDSGVAAEAIGQVFTYGRFVDPVSVVVSGIIGAISGMVFSAVGYKVGQLLTRLRPQRWSEVRQTCKGAKQRQFSRSTRRIRASSGRHLEGSSARGSESIAMAVVRPRASSRRRERRPLPAPSHPERRRNR